MLPYRESELEFLRVWWLAVCTGIQLKECCADPEERIAEAPRERERQTESSSDGDSSLVLRSQTLISHLLTPHTCSHKLLPLHTHSG